MFLIPDYLLLDSALWLAPMQVGRGAGYFLLTGLGPQLAAVVGACGFAHGDAAQLFCLHRLWPAVCCML